MSKKSQSKAFERLKKKADNNPSKVNYYKESKIKVDDDIEKWLLRPDHDPLDDMTEQEKAEAELRRHIVIKDFIISGLVYDSHRVYSADIVQRIVDDWNSGLFDNPDTIVDEKGNEIGKIEKLIARRSEGTLHLDANVYIIDNTKSTEPYYYSDDNIERLARAENYISLSLRGTSKTVDDKAFVLDAVPNSFYFKKNQAYNHSIWYMMVCWGDARIEVHSLQECDFVLE